MPTSGTARAKEKPLARSATITIRDKTPKPAGQVEVAPWTGRVHFVNKDDKDYRLRFWRPGTEELQGVDVLLPAGGRISVLIKKDDVFSYAVSDLIERVASGKGSGPIIN